MGGASEELHHLLPRDLSTGEILAVDHVRAQGHPEIRATHWSTFEITRDTYLTHRGTCIIGVSADKAVADLRSEVKQYLRKGYPVLLILRAGPHTDYVLAWGHPHLTLQDRRSLVVRKSMYVDDRTLCVCATKAARDLRRDLVKVLRNPNTVLHCWILVLRTVPTVLTRGTL